MRKDTEISRAFAEFETYEEEDLIFGQMLEIVNSLLQNEAKRETEAYREQREILNFD